VLQLSYYLIDVSSASTVSYYLSPLENNDRSLTEQIVDLSAKTHSSEAVTDFQKTRTAKKPSVRKRKKVDSGGKQTARKKAAPRKKPKRCSACQVVKPCNEYFATQLSKTTQAKCIDCVVEACRTIMVALNKPRTNGRSFKKEIKGPETH